MKNFVRSLKYLWPYRLRLGLAIVCVVFIAFFWGSGLGMLLPGAKILLSPEGLHGWAYSSLANDHLGGHVVRRTVEPGHRVAGTELSIIVDVVDVTPGGPLDRAGIRPGRWLVGTELDGQPSVVRGDVLLTDIAKASAKQVLRLVVYEPTHGTATQPAGTVCAVKLAPGGLQSELLGRAASMIPDPGDSFPARFPMFMGLLGVALVITYLRGIFTYFQEYLVGTAIWRGIMDLRCENYNVVLHLPTAFFSEKGVSDATSRFIADTGELARGQNILFGKTLVEPAKGIASLIVALICSWQLTLLALVGGPPAYWVIRQLGKSMHRASKRALENWSAMLAVLSETLLGIRVVKAYTMEGTERRRFFRVNRALLKQLNKMERLDAATGPSVECLGLTAGLVAAGLAGYLVFNYKMDAFYFLTWMGALFALFDPLRKLAKVSLKFQQSEAAAARVFQLQDTPQEKAVRNAPTLPRHSKSIDFENVTLRYPNAAVDAVRDLTLHIKAGQTVAIVGPNGSGKTTLLSMLPRLLDPTAGRILIDGMDISQCSIRSLRRQIGLVTQEIVMFHATIGENISYGLRRPHQEDVLAAAKKAFVDEFVHDLPMGYDTMVGEQGATLSGGQRQRIAIARAILRDPAILIFDEAMSQVDSDSERRIHQAMEQFVKGRTTLLIAHRFATVLSADMIVVMENGRMIDAGTHGELVERCGLYRHLYQTQFIDSTARENMGAAATEPSA